MKGTRLLSLGVFVAGCVGEESESQRIDVSEANALGVTTLAIDRVADNDNSVFTLRALAGNDREVGSVELTLGSIADMTKLLPAMDDDVGSQLVITVGDATFRSVSREMHRFVVRGADDPAIHQLLELAAVANTLEREASIIIPTRAKTTEIGYAWAWGCDPSQVLVTPVAKQCCYQADWNPSTGSTVFIRATDGLVVYREYNAVYGTGCKAADGYSACSNPNDGTSCYFGPNGYGRPSVVNGGSNVAIQLLVIASGPEGAETYDGYCMAASGTPSFSDVTGTLPAQSCPGGNSNSGYWSY